MMAWKPHWRMNRMSPALRTALRIRIFRQVRRITVHFWMPTGWMICWVAIQLAMCWLGFACLTQCCDQKEESEKIAPPWAFPDECSYYWHLDCSHQCHNLRMPLFLKVPVKLLCARSSSRFCGDISLASLRNSGNVRSWLVVGAFQPSIWFLCLWLYE